MNEVWTTLTALAHWAWERALAVLAYPIDPHQRVYWLYLCTSVLFAAGIYLRRQRLASAAASAPTLGGFLRFLFPAEVWRSPSAWLDVRYFFFHQFFRFGIYTTLIAASGAAVLAGVNLLFSGQVAPPDVQPASEPLAAAVAFGLAVLLLTDFVSWAIHYWQHRSPILWEFHKVHHSAEVMHPLSNYREHPVDNLVYAVGTGAAAGLVAGLSTHWLGYVPSAPTALGVGVGSLLFNVMAYNLRHSHIWLTWKPAALNKVFGSPAHHHVHHSAHPDHIDKNFGFMFAIWDVLFKTYCLPPDNRDVRFGLDSGDAGDYRSCLALYVVPFRKAFARRAPAKAVVVSVDQP